MLDSYDFHTNTTSSPCASLKKMSDILLQIEKIINGGYGLARHDNGQIVLIRHALVGERVKARIIQEKRGFAEAAITEIVEASPRRIAPPCPHYGVCGGCDLQICDYEQQLLIKRKIIADLLRRSPVRHLQQAVSLLTAPLASPHAFGYRQRLRLHTDEHGRPGFRRFHSHQCVTIRECLLARPELNRALQQLQSQPSFLLLMAASNELELLLNPTGSRVVVLFHHLRKPRPAIIRQAKSLQEALPLIDWIELRGQDFSPLIISDTVGPHPSLQLHLPPFSGNGSRSDTPLSLAWEAGGFCQVNLEQNIQLIQTVLRACQPDPDTSILDLFCGMGNFSLPLAMRAVSLHGVEGQGSAIRCARKNSERAGLTNTVFEKSPLHPRCQSLVAEGRQFDCVLIDPPRQGAPGLAATLALLTRQRLVYVSCDPATLCRDLGELLQHGFTLQSLQPVDMFPQTHHIETVALLTKTTTP